MTLHEIHTRIMHRYTCAKGIRLTAEELRLLVEQDTAMRQVIDDLRAEEDGRRYEEDGEAAAHLNGSWA